MVTKTRRIGTREAKSRLGRLIADVRAGAEWVITDRGRPVARLVPVGSEHLTLSSLCHGEVAAVIARIRRERDLSDLLVDAAREARWSGRWRFWDC